VLEMLRSRLRQDRYAFVAAADMRVLLRDAAAAVLPAGPDPAGGANVAEGTSLPSPQMKVGCDPTSQARKPDYVFQWAYVCPNHLS